jgi:hypothetical protein
MVEPPSSGEYPHLLAGLVALGLDLRFSLEVLLVGDLSEPTLTL